MRLLCSFLMLMSAFPAAAAPKVLMLNFNNQSKETDACASADPDNVYTVDDETKKLLNPPEKWVDATTVGRMLDEMDKIAVAQNYAQSLEADDCANQVDTITISGHHGVNGNFFGGKKDQNGITAKQLREQLKARPNICRCLKNVVLMGCYTGTVDAGESHWLGKDGAKLCPNVNFTMGFPLQAPVGTDPRSAAVLKKMCSPATRKAAARVGSSKSALCEFYKNMPMLAKYGVSVSNCYNIASSLYGSQACYSFDELKAKCADFDPGGAMRAEYDAYFNAEPGFEMPPKDGADIEADPGKGPIRKYYNQLHLWYHCRLPHGGNPGLDMPSTGEVIKLAKFTQIRNNINRLNRQEIAEYDATLRAAGLGKYALGDLQANDRSRRFIIGQIAGAQNALRQNYDPNDRNMRALWEMNNGLEQTLVKLRDKSNLPDGSQANCSFFSLVHEGATSADAKSQCIVGYQEALRLSGVPQMSQQPAISRRRVPRRTFDNPVGVLIGGVYSTERAFQVGEGGMMLSYSPRDLVVGTYLVASFFLTVTSTVIVRGVVRSVVPADTNAPARYGIEFVNLEFQYKREIRNFVASATNTEAA